MKYLKLFELYNTFYHEIPVEEYENILYQDDVPKGWKKFTEAEISTILDSIFDIYGDESVDMIFYNKNIVEMCRIGSLDIDKIDTNDVYRITIESEDASEGEVHICKTVDEWYFIERPPMWSGEEDDPIRFFRCDQFDGLIEFLKNEI